jgi:hypothetical protein
VASAIQALLHAAGQDGLLADGERLGPVVVDEVLGRLAEGSLLAFIVDGQAVIAPPGAGEHFRRPVRRSGLQGDRFW